MSPALGQTVVRGHLGLRRRVRLARGRLWSAYPGLSVGPGVQLGRGLRLRIEPGGQVVLAAGCEIDDGVTLAVSSGGEVRIGEAAFVGHHATVAARREVVIGARSFVAELVSVRDHDHDPAEPPSSGMSLVDPVRVGDDCWLASKVTVTRGVTLGDRVVVGAHAVVTRSLPAGSFAVGVPAQAVGQRDRSGAAGGERRPDS